MYSKRGGGGGSLKGVEGCPDPPPPTVVSRSNTSLGGGGVNTVDSATANPQNPLASKTQMTQLRGGNTHGPQPCSPLWHAGHRSPDTRVSSVLREVQWVPLPGASEPTNAIPHCRMTRGPQGGGGGGQDRAHRGMRPEPTPMSHLQPRFSLPSLTVIVTRRPNHLRGGPGGGRGCQTHSPPAPTPRRC